MNKLENYRPCVAVKPVTAKLLLLILREITDDRDTVIVPHRRIAEAIGMSRSAVGRNLRRLERAGAISIEPLYSEYSGRLPNKYRLKRRASDGR
jgi:DNA-binding Lrp family transcriptional regulator